MSLYIEVPEDTVFAPRSRWTDLSLHVREQLAVDDYEQGLLSLAQVRRLLGLETRWDAQSFLGKNGVAVFDLDLAELSREGIPRQQGAAGRRSTLENEKQFYISRHLQNALLEGHRQRTADLESGG